MENTMIYLEHTHSLPEHLHDCATQNRQPETGVYLVYDGQILSLAKVGEKGRVCVDFVGGAAQYRRTKGGGELIGKAVNHTTHPVVWDATGGLGRDAFVLASLGLVVSVFERDMGVVALLRDGLVRARAEAETAEIVSRINLIQGNAAILLPEYAQKMGQPDVVYLDPMYPERQKSAAVKKEMAYFHEWVGLSECDDDAQLFQAARMVAKKRVVVKRPRLGECLCGVKPAYQYEGKSTRFDVYLPLGV